MRHENIIRRWAKKLLAIAPLPLSRNERIDRLTRKIIRKTAHAKLPCIDIGANEGRILKWMMEDIPGIRHYAFEPIPHLFVQLQSKFGNKAQLFQMALSDQTGTIEFNEVLTDPAYSGILKRPYPASMRERSILVHTDCLDHLIPKEQGIGMIKMDVEGAEWLVLKGARNTILRHRPLILFECGKAGGITYGYDAKDMFELWEANFQYHIFLLQDWLQQKNPLTKQAFIHHYEKETEYFFLAAPKINGVQLPLNED